MSMATQKWTNLHVTYRTPEWIAATLVQAAYAFDVRLQQKVGQPEGCAGAVKSTLNSVVFLCVTASYYFSESKELAVSPSIFAILEDAMQKSDLSKFKELLLYISHKARTTLIMAA